MKRLYGSTAAKLCAFFLCIVTALVMAAGLVALVLFSWIDTDIYQADEITLRNRLYDHALRNYTVWILSAELDGNAEAEDYLRQVGLDYSVEDVSADIVRGNEKTDGSTGIPKYTQNSDGSYSGVWQWYDETYYSLDTTVLNGSYYWGWDISEDGRHIVTEDYDNVEAASDGYQPHYYLVTITPPETADIYYSTTDLFAQANFLVWLVMDFRTAVPVLITISALLFAAAFIFLICASGHRRGSELIERRAADRIPLGISLIAVICIMGTMFAALSETWNLFKASPAISLYLVGLVIVVSVSLGLWWCMSLAVNIKAHTWRESLLICRLVKWLWGRLAGFWSRFREGVRSTAGTVKWTARLWIAYAIFALVEFICLGVGEPETMLLGLALIAALGVGLYFYMKQAARLKVGAERIAAGGLSANIDTDKMFLDLSEHGDTLNRIADGLNAAVNERMKSERMRTELITNVSHDIKTPLTSIVNYVDLLSKRPTEDKESREYIDILKKQSERMKKLIEDLIEVSRASTGNIELHPEEVDLAVMLSQTEGEYRERLAAKGIELIVTSPEEPVSVKADRRSLWRIYDNLLCNIEKYGQSDTRSYINTECNENSATVIFRNTSREPLNITGDELMERFVRGDVSRSTEGSGLGLSIAGSLAELMGGKLDVTVDGDLFKAAVTLPL